MKLPLTSELVRTAPPVYRCVHCFRRHEDHRGASLSCPRPHASTFDPIPYESHAGMKP